MNIEDEWDTLDKLKQGCSIARFSEIEFSYILERKGASRQIFDPELGLKIRAVFKSKIDGLCIGVPNIYKRLSMLNPDWTQLLTWTELRNRTRPLLSPKKLYNSCFFASPEVISGLFVDLYFEKLRDVWKGRDIVLVGQADQQNFSNWNCSQRSAENMSEHPLFNLAATVTHLPAPDHNPYDAYDDLISQAKTNHKDTLFLAFLGPCSPLFAYDLHNLGYQVIDAGDLITSYELFTQGVPPRFISSNSWEARESRLLEMETGIHKMPDIHPLHALNQVVLPEIKNRLVFDIGANNGLISQFFVDAGAKVVAVEPQKSLTDGADVFKKVHALRNICLADYEGFVEFYRCNLETYSTCSPPWREGQFRGKAQWALPDVMPCTTLDRLIEEFGAPHYIKIDVENYDAKVLAGLNRPIPMFSFEYTGGYPENYEACLEHVDRLMYTRLIAFQMVRSKNGFATQIIELDHLDACLEYFRTLPKYTQGDLLVINNNVVS